MPNKKNLATLYVLPIKADCAIRADMYGLTCNNVVHDTKRPLNLGPMETGEESH